jgi:hypothetical protein
MNIHLPKRVAGWIAGAGLAAMLLAGALGSGAAGDALGAGSTCPRSGCPDSSSALVVRWPPHYVGGASQATPAADDAIAIVRCPGCY